MLSKTIPVWKEAPFLRLVPPFIAGILLQRQTGVTAVAYWSLLAFGGGGFIFFSYLSSFTRFSYYKWAGLLVHALMLATGALVSWYNDARHQSGWIGHTDRSSTGLFVTLEEPLHKKAASYKALASVEGLIQHHRFTKAGGKIFLYFSGNRPPPGISYHSRILFCKPLQSINNLGNPACFDYKEYCAYQNIFHQVYLQPGDYALLDDARKNDLAGTLFLWRQRIIHTIRRWVSARQAGLAEALLIGYKDDLDKDLVQSYANTGVVHIIAISGLHLGLIYWLLVQVFGWIKWRRLQWLKLLLIVGALWTFGLLTGGSPSVMRSALMFTFLAAGRLVNKRGSIHNSLAASALLLLCYNPYWLWDAGFQLSYSAVLSIVLFMRPLYNLVYVKNKLLDAGFKLLATSLAAQILTAPIGIYLFHQFPVNFLLTNLVAVPLSSVVVLAEIGVCVFAGIPWLAKGTGGSVSCMIEWMNSFVIYMEQLPLSMWGGLQISLPQTVLLYAIIAALSGWLLQKKPRLLPVALGLLMLFMLLRTSQFRAAARQQKMIVYHVPKHGAIHLVSGRHALLVADSALMANGGLVKTSVEPAMIAYRFTNAVVVHSDGVAIQGFYFAGKRILLYRGMTEWEPALKRTKVDLIIVSGGQLPHPEILLQAFDCSQVVLDGSVSARRVEQWKLFCKRSGLACHAVSEKGAFVLQAD